MYVILLGPPGVGKGTQGVLLADAQGWDRVVTGDLLRQARAEGTELGRQAEAYMNAGELVPDPVILGMVKEKLESLSPGGGVVFDGFPRTETQASGLAMQLQSLGRGIDHVVVLEADDDVLVRRIAGRRSCPECGAVYNVYMNPPEQDGVCDRCGHALVQRPDDHEDTVRRRLEVYRRQTAPLVAYYEAGPVPVHHVDGDGAVEAVQARVRSVLGLGA
ncbi:MAG: adenylate kinase [Gemmatimonadetes bacterium]|nr:MAG: adenylate kinase [Gemmatimonadota bacterium]